MLYNKQWEDSSLGKKLEDFILKFDGKLDSFIKERTGIGGWNPSSEKVSNKGFRIDEPSEGDDYLRKDFASTVVELMRNTDVKQSAFSIGINGCWGSGKTSFFNLMKEEMQQADCIQIDFRAWMCSSPNEIVMEFFKTLKRELSPLNPRIDNRTDRYIDALIEMDSSNSIRALKQIICEVPSAAKGYDDLSREIQTINRRIYVFIDDLDRMDAKEIMEVLRLVRNTANFPNLFYIMAYDKEYVVKTLSEANYHNPEKYLEKILNVDLFLPGFEPETVVFELIRMIEEKYKEKFDEEEIEETGSLLIFYFIVNSSKRNSVFTFRDMNRFMNNLTVTLESFLKNGDKEDISLQDIVTLELIKYYQRYDYEVLRYNPEMFYTKTDGKYEFRSLDRRDNSEQLLDYLMSNDSKKSICYCANYYRFFASRLMKNDIDFLEFISNMYAPDPKIKILKWVEKKDSEAIKLHFRRVLASPNVEVNLFLKSLTIYGECIFVDENFNSKSFKELLDLFNSIIPPNKSKCSWRFAFHPVYKKDGKRLKMLGDDIGLYVKDVEVILAFFRDTSELVYSKIALLLSVIRNASIEKEQGKLFDDLIMKLLSGFYDKNKGNRLLNNIEEYLKLEEDKDVHDLYERFKVIRDKYPYELPSA
ncbi:hypothetical protein MASR1M31_01960 [Porphyromonadaceae bacterium]